MKKYTIIFALLLIGILSLSFVYAQIGGRQQMGPPLGPPGNAIAKMSPDYKFIYVLYNDKLHQYIADNLKLKRTVYIDSSSESRIPMPMSGGSMFFSKDGKLLYIIRSKTMYLFDTSELSYIKKVSFE